MISASLSTSSSAASSWCRSAGSSVSAITASNRSFIPVSGVRSWCEAFATNSRWARTVRSSRPAISSNERPSSTISLGPASCAARAERSPPPSRRAAPAKRVSGREREPASAKARRRPATSPAKPIAASPSVDPADVVVHLLDVLGDPHGTHEHAVLVRDRHGGRHQVPIQIVAVPDARRREPSQRVEHLGPAGLGVVLPHRDPVRVGQDRPARIHHDHAGLGPIRFVEHEPRQLLLLIEPVVIDRRAIPCVVISAPFSSSAVARSRRLIVSGTPSATITTSRM